MNDTQVVIALIASLRAFLDANGLNDVAVKQAYQPGFKVGPEDGRGLYLSRVKRRRYGHNGQKHVYNETTGMFDRTDSFISLVTYQIDAVSNVDDPDDFNILSPGDLAEAAADGLSMAEAREYLLSQGLTLERITEIRPSYTLDENEQHESSPSFDVTICYKRTYNNQVHPATAGDYEIKGV